MTDKANKVKLLQRKAEIEEMVLQGASVSQIAKYAKDNYGISRRQVDNYLSKIYKDWELKIDKDRNKTFNAHLRKRERIFQKAYKDEAWNTCLSILKDIADLQGFYKVDEASLSNQFIGMILGVINVYITDPTTKAKISSAFEEISIKGQLSTVVPENEPGVSG